MDLLIYILIRFFYELYMESWKNNLTLNRFQDSSILKNFLQIFNLHISRRLLIMVQNKRQNTARNKFDF